MSMIEQAIEDRFARDYDKYRNEMIKKLNRAIENANGVPIIFAEGVSYVASKKLLWEEKSNSYWKLIDEMMDAYKKAGLWGTIIRCNCGMEDPSWNVCPEKLIKANKRFLED
jgi:threonine aldolase